MATISLDIQLSNPAAPQLKPMTATALVDMGATTLCIPEFVAIQLQLQETEKRVVNTADGKSQVVPYMGPLKIQYEGRTCYTGAIVMGDTMLMGAIPLEDMDLILLPAERKVVVNPKSPNIPSAIVK
jgi:clan AA aspartic protease